MTTVEINELALRIKNGEDLYPDLWRGVRPFVIKKASARAFAVSRQDDYEDLLQETYLILPDAIGYWDPMKSSFVTTLLQFFAPKAFDRALFGGLSERFRQDPVLTSLSLDRPAPFENDSDILLSDTIIDPDSEDPFLEIDDADFRASLRHFITLGLTQLPERHRNILLAVYFDRISISEAYRQKRCGDYSVQRYAQLHREALNKLQHWITEDALTDTCRMGLLDMVPSMSYYTGGLTRFKQTHDSSVERIAIRHLDGRNARTVGLDHLLRTAADQ